MRSGIALEVIREEVLIEAGFDTSAGSAAFTQDRITQMINRTERFMFEDDDWAILNFEQTVTTTANVANQSLPSTIKFTDIRTAHVDYGNEWLLLAYGIQPEHRAVYNSTQRSSPALRWEVIPPGDTLFELWPIGAATQDVLFSGMKTLSTMSDENDLCTLDADIIVLRVAAEILGRDKKEDASIKLQMAARLTAQIVKKMDGAKAAPINFGASQPMRLRSGIDYIAPGS